MGQQERLPSISRLLMKGYLKKTFRNKYTIKKIKNKNFSFYRFLKGAEELELKKLIKVNFGGGVKEFIFEEQEFYQDIENEDIFLNTQERQEIIYDTLNRLTVGGDSSDENLVIEGRKVPIGKKLSKKSAPSLYSYPIIKNQSISSLLVSET